MRHTCNINAHRTVTQLYRPTLNRLSSTKLYQYNSNILTFSVTHSFPPYSKRSRIAYNFSKHKYSEIAGPLSLGTAPRARETSSTDQKWPTGRTVHTSDQHYSRFK